LAARSGLARKLPQSLEGALMKRLC
jgi:hypothetical protein